MPIGAKAVSSGATAAIKNVPMARRVIAGALNNKVTRKTARGVMFGTGFAGALYGGVGVYEHHKGRNSSAQKQQNMNVAKRMASQQRGN